MKTITHHLSAGPTRLRARLQNYLRTHSGETISRQQLCSEVWQMNYFQSSRTIDQTISVVRKHLEAGERIITVFGVGYRHEFFAPELVVLPSSSGARSQPGTCVRQAA